MRLLIVFFSVIFCLILSPNALSITKEQRHHEKSLTELAKEICSSELIIGKNVKTKVLANGKIEVSFFGKKGGAIDGTFVYDKTEWEGRQRVLQTHQLEANKIHTDCMKEERRILRKNYTPPKDILAKRLDAKDFERRPMTYETALKECDTYGGVKPAKVPNRDNKGLWNLSLLKTATISDSSTIAGYPSRHTAIRGIDGWYNNCRSWIPATNEKESLSIDFGQSVSIYYIKFGSENQPTFNDRSINNWSVFIDNGHGYKLVKSQNNTQIHRTRKIQFNKKLEAKKLKLMIHGGKKGVSRIDELEVYGDI